jgi:DNA-dependent RNA polymerase auxiliary subunit epsilon
VLRANALDSKKIYLGMDASVEKQKFGSRVVPKSVYVQSNDNYNMEFIETVYNKKSNYEKATI